MATYTNSITLVAVEDGADGKAPIYDIELSNEKIYKLPFKALLQQSARLSNRSKSPFVFSYGHQYQRHHL